MKWRFWENETSEDDCDLEREQRRKDLTTLAGIQKRLTLVRETSTISEMGLVIETLCKEIELLKEGKK